MTPGQFKLKRAYHIDPLMAAMVVVENPPWATRSTNEVDTMTVVKELNKQGLKIAPPVSRRRRDQFGRYGL
jgi:hypothetical protein